MGVACHVFDLNRVEAALVVVLICVGAKRVRVLSDTICSLLSIFLDAIMLAIVRVRFVFAPLEQARGSRQLCCGPEGPRCFLNFFDTPWHADAELANLLSFLEALLAVLLAAIFAIF